MANESRDKLISTTVSALRTRWRAVKARLIRGNWQPDAESGGYGCFEADTTVHQKTLARRFYSIQHADKLLSLTDDVLSSNILAYAEPAVFHAWKEYPDEPGSQRKYMRSLAKYEYVILENHGVYPYPARVLYDDWYERSVGASQSFQGYIMKSTGESFTETEARWVNDSVLLNTRDTGDFWRSDTYLETNNKIFVQIMTVERWMFIESFQERMRRAKKSQIIDLITHLRINFPDYARESKILDKLVSPKRNLAKSELISGLMNLAEGDENEPVFATTINDIMTHQWGFSPRYD